MLDTNNNYNGLIKSKCIVFFILKVTIEEYTKQNERRNKSGNSTQMTQ